MIWQTKLILCALVYFYPKSAFCGNNWQSSHFILVQTLQSTETLIFYSFCPRKYDKNALDKKQDTFSKIAEIYRTALLSKAAKYKQKYKIHLSFYSKIEKILKGSLDSIPLPSPSVKIQIMGRKVCLRCKGKTLLGVFKSLLTSPSNVLPCYLK